MLILGKGAPFRKGNFPGGTQLRAQQRGNECLGAKGWDEEGQGGGGESPPHPQAHFNLSDFAELFFMLFV